MTKDNKFNNPNRPSATQIFDMLGYVSDVQDDTPRAREARCFSSVVFCLLEPHLTHIHYEYPQDTSPEDNKAIVAEFIAMTLFV